MHDKHGRYNTSTVPPGQIQVPSDREQMPQDPLQTLDHSSQDGHRSIKWPQPKTVKTAVQQSTYTVHSYVNNYQKQTELAHFHPHLNFQS